MRHIYSILMLISLLFVGTACEDDYRDIVFFTGDAPIYQVGTCGNMFSSTNLYLNKPEGIIVGVDGGDGNYSIVNGDDAIEMCIRDSLYNQDTKVDDKNKTTGLTLSERLNGAYRNDWFEFGLNGSISYTAERSKLRPENNQEPYTFSYGANTQLMAPWNMTFTTNIANQSRRGYTCLLYTSFSPFVRAYQS